MRDFLKAFLLSMFFVSGVFNPAFCGVGNVDNRFYVDGSMWSQEPYRRFVHLEAHMYNFGGSTLGEHMKDCSAQYISKNLILSAGHCVVENPDVYDVVSYEVNNYKGETIPVSLLESKYAGTDKGDDWAIFFVDDSKYYSDSFFDIKVPSSNTNVINAGWGSVRILSDSELEKIRQLSQGIKNLHSDEFYSALVQKMQANGMKPLKEDPKTLKASKCKIVFDDSRNAQRSKYFPDILATTCDTWSGNSGGGYVSLDGNYLYGVAAFNYSGYASFDENVYSNYMSSARQFADAVTRLKQQYSDTDAKISTVQTHEPIDVQPLSFGVTQSALTGNESQNILNNTSLPAPNTRQGYVETQPKRVDTKVEQPTINKNTALNKLPTELPAGSKDGFVYLDNETLNATASLTGNESQNILNNTSLPAPNTRQGYVETQPKRVDTKVEQPIINKNTALNKLSTELPAGSKDGFVYLDNETLNATASLTGNESQNILNNLSLNTVLPKKQIEKEINDLETKVQNQSKEIERTIPKVTKLSNSETLAFVNVLVEHDIDQSRLEELKKAYEDAKSKEQSFANRALTAASVAAMGIGGMELARGLAEQKADKEAEQSMDAYIATMRCKYGSNSVKVGTGEIELPGGNNANMMELRNEYFSLATDLKERKAALGMTPGIESETIMDKSDMGLYTQENVGITGGAYSSLYRAKVMESEKDKTQIDEEKSKTNNRVVGGGAATAVGGAGGVIGNAVINRK